VTVEMVIEILHCNTELAQQAVRSLVRELPPERLRSCSNALATALITQPDIKSPNAPTPGNLRR
jgi:hypothetical protein